MLGISESEFKRNLVNRFILIADPIFSFLDYPIMNILLGRYSRFLFYQIAKIIRGPVQTIGKIRNHRNPDFVNIAGGKIVIEQKVKPLQNIFGTVITFTPQCRLAVMET